MREIENNVWLNKLQVLGGNKSKLSETQSGNYKPNGRLFSFYVKKLLDKEAIKSLRKAYLWHSSDDEISQHMNRRAQTFHYGIGDNADKAFELLAYKKYDQFLNLICTGQTL